MVFMDLKSRFVLIALLLLSLLPGLARPGVLRAGKGTLPSITGPCGLVFPKDHGPHPEYGLEWWYYTGNLEDSSNRAFGFELTFFRRRQPRPEGDEPSAEPSAWRTEQIWAAHCALTDIQGGVFHQHERTMRGALGLAGAELDNRTWRFNVKNWRIVLGPAVHRLRARVPDLRIDLDLRPSKGPVLHGQAGYSRKGSRPSSASCYVSFPRMEAAGRIRLKDRTFKVRGQAWMDHEFSSSLLEPDIEGWDWFGLQLDTGAEIMLFQLRREEGGRHPASAGSSIDPQGTVQQLRQADFDIEVLDVWQSPQTGIRYPSGWQLQIPILDLDLEIRPRLAEQEMLTQASSGMTYWEGSVTVAGRQGGTPVKGLGYVELTGYGRSVGVLGQRPEEASR